MLGRRGPNVLCKSDLGLLGHHLQRAVLNFGSGPLLLEIVKPLSRACYMQLFICCDRPKGSATEALREDIAGGGIKSGGPKRRVIPRRRSLENL